MDSTQSMTTNFAIITDSTSDFPEELREKHDVYIVPARVIIGEKEYLDRVGITREEIIYQLEHSKEKITTTQPLPADFQIIFSEVLEKYEKILFLSVSSGLSATYQNGVLVAKRIGKDRIVCIDTKTVSNATALLAYHAVIRREQGVEFEKVVEEINQMVPSIKLVFIVESLDYLHRGGRIGRAKHLIGTILNKKPILNLVDGEISAIETVKGSKAGFELMGNLIKQYAEEYKNYCFASTYGKDNPQFNRFVNKLKNGLKPLHYFDAPTGAGVLTHVGPDVEAVMIIKIPDESLKSYS